MSQCVIKHNKTSVLSWASLLPPRRASWMRTARENQPGSEWIVGSLSNVQRSNRTRNKKDLYIYIIYILLLSFIKANRVKKTTFYKPDSASSLSSPWCSWRKHVWANVTRLGGGPNQNDEMSASFSKAWGFVSLFFFVVRIGPAGGPLQNAKQSKLTTNTGQKKGICRKYIVRCFLLSCT